MKDEFDVLEQKLEKVAGKGLTNYRTFKLFFVILSFSILLSPAVFTQYIDKYTQFEDYPEPLRQFYNERIYEKWRIGLQPVYAQQSPVTTRLASPDNSNISDREVIDYGNGLFKQRIGIPQYVLDSSDSTFKDSFRNENSTHIKWVNAQDPVIFKKSDCTFTKYTDTTFSTKFADYHTTMAYKPSGQAWTVYDVLQLPCTYNIFSNATGQYLTVQRVHQKGTFDVTYVKLKDGAFKSYMKFTNGGSPNGFSNTRVSFVEVIGNITTNSFNINNTNWWNNINVGTQKVFTQNNLTSLGKKAFSFAKSSLLFNINLGSDFSDLLAIRATKSSAITLDLEIGFGATSTNLAYNQIVSNDPTYSSNNPTADGQIRDFGTSNDLCDGNNFQGDGGGSTANIGTTALSNGQSDCDRAYFEWDITSISNTATITDVDFKFDVSSVITSPANCDFMPMTTVRPSTGSSANIWAEIGNGTEYVNASSLCTTAGDNKSVDLGTTADSDLQTKLTADWFAVGMKYDSETLTADDRVTQVATEEDAGATPKPTLEVTYTVPANQYVRLLENDGSTAVSSASIIQANATRPTASQTSTKTTNSTGWAGGWTGISGNQNYTAKTSTNYVVNKTINLSNTDNFSITSRIYDVTGCDTTISNLMLNETDRHYVASVPLTPSCSNDVLTFNYFYKTLGLGSAGSNQTTLIRMEVPANSVYARNQVALVNGSSIQMTYSGGVLTSGTIQVDAGANNVILKVTINLRENIPVRIFEGDKSTAITSGSLLNKNSTISTPKVNSINSTGLATLFGIYGNQNLTQIDSDNYVGNKTYNFNPSQIFQINSQIYRVSCPHNGVGNDVIIKINNTNFHRISSHTTPTCASGSTMNVTWTATFTADGNASSHTNQTSTLLAEIINTTAFGKQPIRFRENGTAISTTFSTPDITSSAFQVGSGYQTRTISFNLALDPKPAQPSAPTVNCTSSTACTVSWTAPTAGVDGIDGYKIERSTDGSTFTTLVADTGTTTTSYSDSGLTAQQTYYYKIAGINQYGTGQLSSSGSGTTISAGGGISGSSSGSSGSTTPTQTSALSLTVSEVVHQLTLGDILEDRELTITWNSKASLIVDKIVIGDTPIAVIFENFGNDLTLLDPYPKCTSIAGLEKCTSTDTILYSLAVPTKEMDDCLPECVQEIRYDIPVQVYGKIGTETTSAVGKIIVDLGKQSSIPLYLVIMMAVIPIVGILMQKSKSHRKKHENAITRFRKQKK